MKFEFYLFNLWFSILDIDYIVNNSFAEVRKM